MLRSWIVVGVVGDVAPVDVDVEAHALSEGLAKAAFVVISAGRLDGKAEKVIAERFNLRRAGDEDVLEGWSLKDAVVGGVQHQVERWQKTADGDAGAEGVLIEEELIVVPAEAGADRPFAEADHIFDEGGLLKVGPLIREGQSRRGVAIELRRVGDVVVEVFMKEGCVGFDSDFEIPDCCDAQ